MLLLMQLLNHITLMLGALNMNMRNKIMEKVKRIQELRRSNAATAIPSKKKYTRKIKYKNKLDN